MKKFLLIVAFVLCCAQVQAQIYRVSPGHYSSIQQAIDDAENSDVIIVDPNTYLENINFLGKAITVRSTEPNNPDIVAATIIDGSEPDDPNYASVVTFNSGEGNQSVLTGFTITGGTGSWAQIYWQYKGHLWNRCGGGVLCLNGSSPTIKKNVFRDNLAGQGGGIYFYDHSNPVVTENTFIDNDAVKNHGFDDPDPDDPNTYDHGDGGAIVGFQYCDATITGNLIENNHADYYGGGIHLRQWSNGEISENQILNNDAALGGGVHTTYTSCPIVRDNLIKANIAGGLGGGGIYVFGWSQPVIERNLITQNESSAGAGIAVICDSNPTIRNNLIFDNVSGSGIRCKTGSAPRITHNTITANMHGGVECWSDTTPTIENNIITSNGDGYGIYVWPDSSPIARYNNVWGNEAGNYGGSIPDQTGINGNISVAPSFVDEANNNYHLNYDSKCINAGDPNFVPQGDETDYEKDGRLLGQYVDMGADEVWPVWNITSGEQYHNIQAAIDDANDANVIIVTIGTHTGPGNRDIEFLGKAITLQSIDPNNFDVVAATIIDCQGSIPEPHRGFNFHSGEDANSVLAGLTITGGGAHEGTVYCYGSSPTIKNCIITNNIMKDHGGGIACLQNSNPIITNCIISSNSFDPFGYGGGIYCKRSSPTITNCIITNNSAVGPGRHGGGICCWGDQYASSNALVANCIISGNSAGHRGGGLYAYWSSPTLVNCTIIGNRAEEGGGVGSFGRDYIPELVANPTLINCILRRNRADLGPEGALINTRSVWSWGEHSEMTISYCNIEGGQDAIFVDTRYTPPWPPCVLHWGDGNIDTDPNFVDPGYWDDANTPTEPNDDFFVPGNYHLPPNSPCVDAGDNESVPSFLTTDIDGEQRIFNDTVDMGADEVVTNPIDLNNDGIVNYLELAILSGEWLQGGGELQSDFHKDSFIDFADYAELAAEWFWKGQWHK